MPQTLYQRFQVAEEQFLSAFSAGQDATAAFQKTWISLFDDYTIAMKLHAVDTQTQSLARATSARVAVLAEGLLSLDSEAEKHLDSLQSQVGYILGHADEHVPVTPLSSIPSSSVIEPSSNSSHDCDDDSATLPLPSAHSLHAHAHGWLLQNLHYPYPSSETKARVASSSGCSLKDVGAWFADARRQIGWTALTAEKFGGSRRAVTDAAFRAYVKDDTGLASDLRRAFASIQKSAYSLRDSGDTISVSAQVIASEAVEDDLHCLSAPEALYDTQESSLYDEEDTTPPPRIAGFKRRLDVSVDVDEACQSAPPTTTRPSKRHRHSPLITDDSVQWGRPNTSSVSAPTQTMTSDSLNPTSPSPAVIAPSTLEGTDPMSDGTNSSPALSSRKRRLSDALVGNSAKRPRGLTTVPRKQAVSDPLPIGLNSAAETQDLGEWLQLGFNVPYAAELGNFGRSLSCDVGFAAFTAQSDDATSSVPSLGPVVHTAQYLVSDADLASATSEGFDFSAYNPDTRASGFDFEYNSDIATSDGSSASSPSSAGSYSELSEYGLPDNTNMDWSQDWSQFLHILDSLERSPASAQSSLSNLSPPYSTAADSTSSPCPDVITQTLFGADPSFSSDLLSDICEFSSLHMPLQAFS